MHSETCSGGDGPHQILSITNVKSLILGSHILYPQGFIVQDSRPSNGHFT